MKPQHIAIIMDGNRRWAKTTKHSIIDAYEKGVRTLKQTIDNCIKLNIKYLTVFGFSTENWKRSETEISFLLKLFNKFLDQAIQEAKNKEIKINFIGDLKQFDNNIQKKTSILTNLTEKKKNITVNIAVNYGGQQEIIQAIRKYLIGNNGECVNIKKFDSFLFNSNSPAVDLLIRTGGEKRLSNFLLWHLAYTELMFLDEMWPDFNFELLKDSIDEFISRKRKFGGM